MFTNHEHVFPERNNLAWLVPAGTYTKPVLAVPEHMQTCAEGDDAGRGTLTREERRKGLVQGPGAKGPVQGPGSKGW